jgi:hypothetical protein
MRILFYCEGNDDILCLHIKTLRGNMSGTDCRRLICAVIIFILIEGEYLRDLKLSRIPDTGIHIKGWVVKIRLIFAKDLHFFIQN